MRKILLSMISIVIIILLVLCMKTGIKIGPLQVPSVQDLKDESQALDTKIDATNLANKNYESALKKLTTDITTMTNAKKEYLRKVNYSSEELNM